ncbi:ATPase family AAA domain-containing protein 3-like [Zingiber officinale]|uniref:ATPase family AAA domain-containing protein 3-like n=1 Tax=Zingiber officinale TaxID=94328 RepID=UPI001C4D2C3A|nr:ATPase family AAA domain-containing protein 3-like [Zingiber officinale]
MPPMRMLCAAAAVSAATAAAGTIAALSDPAYADGYFRFPFLSSPAQTQTSPDSQSAASRLPGGGQSTASSSSSSGGFDPESLERGAKALREINSSSHAKQVFDLMRKQEETRLAELTAEKAQYLAIQAQSEVEKQIQMAEEQRNLVQQAAQAKAQMARYEDELTRKRMQTEHEAQRKQNVELVRMQEESSLRKEQARRATEEQIQQQLRQTEKERAEIERETIRVKAIAEAEGRAHEAKLTEEHNRRMLLERMKGEREKWLAAINATFSHIEGGLRMLLTDRATLVMAVGGVTALAAGVYTTREGAKVLWGYVNRILGQPSLIRESSIAKFPWSGIAPKIIKLATSSRGAFGKESLSESSFDKVILHPSLKRRIEQLARATENTKLHQAPFRNMLFYGPPGTGKTLVAREIAHKSGLDYAMMTGGDVAPLGSEAVTKIHQIFDWSKKSKKGLLLFIDEADAFLCERNSIHMSEAQRSALNALLFRTGDQSRDVVLVLATNRPGDLDAAVTDRMDEVIEFPLPGEEERYELLKLYLRRYILQEEDSGERSWNSLFTKRQQKITVRDVSDEVLREAAKNTAGFSGREIAKLMASVQAAVYGRPDCVLDPELFSEVVNYKVTEHHQRIKLAAEATC